VSITVDKNWCAQSVFHVAGWQRGARQDGKFYGCFDVPELISNSEVNAWSLPVKHLLFERYLGVVCREIIYTHHRGIGRNWMK
jgi:hypothetical protein